MSLLHKLNVSHPIISMLVALFKWLIIKISYRPASGRNVFHRPICYAYFAKFQFQIWCWDVHQSSNGPEKLKLPRNPIMFFEIRIALSWHKNYNCVEMSNYSQIISSVYCMYISAPCNQWWTFYTSLACQFETHCMSYSIEYRIWNRDTFIVNASRHFE